MNIDWGCLMQKTILLILLLLALSVSPLSAQDDDYRLREPSVEEYLEAIPQLFEVMVPVQPVAEREING